MNELMHPDIFDRIMSLRLLRWLQPFYLKYKEPLLYLFFGGLTTLVSIGVFYLFDTVVGIDPLIANFLSWLAAVTFAFITNRIWVFRARTDRLVAFARQMVSFYGGRAMTLLFEEVVILIFITNLGFNSMAVKICAQFGVLLLNYIISKCIVFRKKPSA